MCDCGRCYYEKTLLDIVKRPRNRHYTFWKLIANGGHWWK